MAPILQTRRLTLRPLSISDQDALVDVIMSDIDVMQWLPGSDEVSTLEDQRKVALEYIKVFTDHWDNLGYGGWAIYTSDISLGVLESFIGYCGFIPEQIKGAGPELAYAIGKPMWGKSLVTEAATACLDWIFNETDIPCVHAVTDRKNSASRCIMEKLGMKHKKDVDLYNSVAKGEGLLPFFSIERNIYLKR